MNYLIEEWKKGAQKIYDAETKLNEYTGRKKRDYTYSYLAQVQIERLEATKPNKEKPLEEQLNELQKECYLYLRKVANTNEI